LTQSREIESLLRVIFSTSSKNRKTGTLLDHLSFSVGNSRRHLL
jgi:hypothetical protein